MEENKDIFESKSWWTGGLWPFDSSNKVQQDNSDFNWKIIGRPIIRFNDQMDDYENHLIANNNQYHALSPREFQRLKSFEEKYESTCQEYENTIEELENIIGTQQRAFLDLINNLELEISRNQVMIAQLGEEIEDLEFELALAKVPD